MESNCQQELESNYEVISDIEVEMANATAVAALTQLETQRKSFLEHLETQRQEFVRERRVLYTVACLAILTTGFTVGRMWRGSDNCNEYQVAPPDTIASNNTMAAWINWVFRLHR